MSGKIIIFGKEQWPHTVKAREVFAKRNIEIEYYDVTKDEKYLEKMLVYSKGERRIPVIIDGTHVTVGYEGRTWRI